MIRQANKTDAQQLADIAYLVLAELYPTSTIDEIKTQQQKKDLAFLIARDDVPMSYRHVLVYEEKQQILGAIWSYEYMYYNDMLARLYMLEKEQHIFIPHLEEEAEQEDYYIDTIAVLPSARGKGIAKKILTTLLCLHPREKVTLIVDEQKAIPFSLYKKIGFQTIKINDLYGSKYHYMQYQGGVTNNSSEL